MARHAALVLKTDLSDLQGEVSQSAPSRIDAIEKRLHALNSNGASPALAQALEACKDDPNPIRELAERIANRLEAAQLSQDRQAFEGISALTGYSFAELNEPASMHGFWMLIGTGAGGPERSEILRGVSAVRYEVAAELREFFVNRHESDTHVAFVREKHWLQIIMLHPRVPHWNRTLRFARCQPHERGLQWVTPTWLDDFWLDEMPRSAYANANFVTGFDATCIPAECTQLRFAISRNPSAEEFEKLGLDATPELVALTVGDLAELHSETLENFKREGNGHHLIINRLAATLWEDLLPWMSDWPLEFWIISTAEYGIVIRTDEIPYRLLVSNTLRPQFVQLHVSLVEQLADGSTRDAPWAAKSIAYVFDRLNTSLHEARRTQAQSPPGPAPV
ncbi:hypothetical protein [Rhodoferax sp.]|uniref:hypothetical protein n=1 Tax=Rhodoferax sp. TaxID=50421 RepID=UPI002ACDF71F|nr:hypothetical protein [Rhodoferax sp.]MDZ7919367.1 hypothetical protein [Rhodoferax sp.]